MRRLPFALAAVAALFPLIACMHAASDDGDESSADIDDQAKQSCNFAFAEVTQPPTQVIARGTTKGVANGQALLFGDFDGDTKVDFLTATATNQVQLWQGDGAGHFVAKGLTSIPTDPTRTLTSIATVAAGDFDGDKKLDAALIVTTVATPVAGAAVDATTTAGAVVILYGKTATAATADAGAPSDDAGADSDAGTPASTDVFDVVVQSKTDPVAASSFELAGDLDGDGIDDFVHVSAKDEAISFGSKDRQLVPSTTHLATTATRSLAYLTPKATNAPASLLIAGGNQANTITFDTTRKATLATSTAPAFAATDSRIGTDLDQDHSPEIAILGNSTLSITPVVATHGKALSFANVPGHLIGAEDLDGNKSSELLYANDTKLMAACGYSANATALAAVQLPVPYPANGFVAGQVDLDKDGHPDLVTMTNDGTMHVYRFNGRNTTAPTLTILNLAVAATDGGADAHADATTGDAAAHDSGATPPSYDAGAATKPNGTGATGTEETEPPASEGSGAAQRENNVPPSVPRPAEDDSTPTAPTAAPTANGGCATTPSQHAPIGFPALLLGALVALGARRRKSARA